VAVELLDARVDDLDRGREVVGGGQHLLDIHVGALQIGLQDEGQLDLDARGDEAAGGQLQHLAGGGGEQHAVEQGAVVGFVDLAGDLHGARGQADLVADHPAPLGQLPRDPGAADAVAVLDRHAGKALGEMLDLHARGFALVQFVGELPDLRVGQHTQVSSS